MAKEVRVITASKDIRALVDRGSEVNADLEAARTEDEVIKAKIKNFVEGEIQKDESNVVVEGTKAKAVITAAESYDLVKSSGMFETVKEHSGQGGLLANAVKRKVELIVPSILAEKAVDILRTHGVDASMSETYEVDAKEFRAARDANTAVLSDEENEARSALMKCAKRSVVYRLKYESNVVK